MSAKLEIPDIPWELVDEAKQKLRKVWMLEDLELQEPALKIGWKRPPIDLLNSQSPKKIVFDPAFDVWCQIEGIKQEIEHLEAGKDIGTNVVNMPGFNLISFGTGPLATAFGAKWINRENDYPFFETVVHSPQEVLKLVKPDLHRNGMLPLILQRIKYYNDATQGKIPITPCDTAGPWSIATQIWHYEDMLEAIHTAPGVVHSFLDLVTDCIIEWYNIQETHIGRWSGTHTSFPWPWYPRGTGIGDDCMVTVSPKTWEEFFLPYNNRLSDEYGGAFYHCCLCYENHLASLIKTNRFMGFDADPKYNTFDKIESMLSLGHGVWTKPIRIDTEDMTTFKDATYYIQRLRGKVGLFFEIYGKNREDAIEGARRLLDFIKTKSGK